MKKREKRNSYLHILKYTGMFGGVQGVNILVGVVRNKLVAMILGPQGMGLISLFNSTIALVSDSTGLGLGMSAVKRLSESFATGDTPEMERSVRVIRSWSLLAGLFGMFVCVVLSPLLDRFTFSWGDHTLHFMLLSPIIPLLAVTNGELAILKATRQLRALAKQSVGTVLLALLLTVPLYEQFGEAAIVPSLVLMAAIQLFLSIVYSYRLYPLRLSLRRETLGAGLPMVKLGVAFVVAGTMTSGAEFVIRSFLNHEGALDTVGLYNAGFMLTTTYVSMIFVAMETDYFPRLSSVATHTFTMNQTVNRQIEVSLLFAAPLIALFMITLPWLVPLLYSGRFTPAVGMAQVSLLGMYMRAVRLPVEYISLAKGDSRSFLVLESVYALLIVGFALPFFRLWGLWGTGLALAVVGLLHYLVVFIYMYRRHGYRVSASVRLYMMLQLPLGLLTFGITLLDNPFLYGLLGVLSVAVSAMISIKILKSKTGGLRGLPGKRDTHS